MKQQGGVLQRGLLSVDQLAIEEVFAEELSEASSLHTMLKDIYLIDTWRRVISTRRNSLIDWGHSCYHTVMYTLSQRVSSYLTTPQHTMMSALRSLLYLIIAWFDICHPIHQIIVQLSSVLLFLRPIFDVVFNRRDQSSVVYLTLFNVFEQVVVIDSLASTLSTVI